jgi:hypothetical protein
MWVVGGMLDETCAYWIRDDIANRERYLVIIPHHALEAITLPELLLVALFEAESRVLFRRFDECLAIRAVAKTVDEKVDVVRHEAVRRYFEVTLTCGSQKLRFDKIHRLRIGEQWSPLIGAESQEIFSLAGV